MADKRIVAAVMGDGRIGLIEEDIPPLRSGSVLVEVHNSLVSPGTELGGWRGLQRQKENPDPNAKPRHFGYSNAGVVLEVGEGVEEFEAGDRVACIGDYSTGPYAAAHADYAVVPHNLCVHLPNEVSFADGAYGHLAAVGLNALRRGAPEFGEYVAVLGLGVVGQLTAMLHHLAGGFVIGWDMIAFRTEIAQKWGIDATGLVGVDDEIELTRAFTEGQGLDGAVFAFAGNGDAALETTFKCLKQARDGHVHGRIVTVGAVTFTYPATLIANYYHNTDIRKASRAGPGYADEAWEFGADYPPVILRWTAQTNLRVCMRLMAQKRLDVGCLTTHTIALENVEQGIASIIDDPDSILGVIFEMKH